MTAKLQELAEFDGILAGDLDKIRDDQTAINRRLDAIEKNRAPLAEKKAIPKVTIVGANRATFEEYSQGLRAHSIECELIHIDQFSTPRPIHTPYVIVTKWAVKTWMEFLKKQHGDLTIVFSEGSMSRVMAQLELWFK